MLTIFLKEIDICRLFLSSMACQTDVRKRAELYKGKNMLADLDGDWVLT